MTPLGTRLILASENLLEQFGTRTERGERITAAWGEPTADGWYEPVFTVHTDDRLDDLDAAWAAAEAALPDGWSLVVTVNRWGTRAEYTRRAEYQTSSTGNIRGPQIIGAKDEPALRALVDALAARLAEPRP
jgi:hypothetical protein